MVIVNTDLIDLEIFSLQILKVSSHFLHISEPEQYYLIVTFLNTSFKHSTK